MSEKKYGTIVDRMRQLLEVEMMMLDAFPAEAFTADGHSMKYAVKHPSVMFARKVRNHEFDELGDVAYESILCSVEGVSVFWEDMETRSAATLARNIILESARTGMSCKDIVDDIAGAYMGILTPAAFESAGSDETFEEVEFIDDESAEDATE